MISSSLHMFFLLNWPINSSLYNMWALVGCIFVTISGFCVFSFLKESSAMMFLFCKEHYDYYYHLRNAKVCPRPSDFHNNKNVRWRNKYLSLR